MGRAPRPPRPDVPWTRAYGGLLAGLLAALCVVAAGYAVVAVLAQATDGAGTVCGSAWRFHVGSGTTLPTSAGPAAQRAEFVRQCELSGDADWNRGVRWATLSAAAGTASVALTVALAVAARRERFRPRRPVAPVRTVSGPAAPPAPTVDLRPASGRWSPRPRRPAATAGAAAPARPPSRVS